ncbi:hypothetical protein DSCO28_18560 [Desulfosarcina ovata subsp. sediminis]|uniref:Uncharacterized protein n=1 Tax=Desulfosarcina ovata subsp. sediminis TaxID=885957 RepID=A0A5K7ZPZ9_9BACT|nr:hypothetical protein DSCO28_18560 [Desulfosarcina ovata subsp. sediminis]
MGIQVYRNITQPTVNLCRDHPVFFGVIYTMGYYIDGKIQMVSLQDLGTKNIGPLALSILSTESVIRPI